jgi:peptidoglycan biosynthesis protein MviN/MurJ (putative lipid II flippase)
MQGFGDNVTPLISSSMELIVKVLAATFLAPAIGYMGIIVAEPIAWVVMVVPLLISMKRFFRKYNL